MLTLSIVGSIIGIIVLALLFAPVKCALFFLLIVSVIALVLVTFFSPPSWGGADPYP